MSKTRKSTIEVQGTAIAIFKGLEFETFRKQAGLNSFSLTPRKWVEANNIPRLK